MNSGKFQIHASASGRVNLIGEHTDYNGGFVLPTAIPQKTHVQLSPRTDNRVNVKSGTVEKNISEAQYLLGEEEPKSHWLDYVQGVTAILAKDGIKISGFDCEIQSTVPMGSGLSSSAALEVSLFRAIREAFQLDLNDVSIAQLCQRVENEFVGARVGIMDPMAASLADLGTALFLDTRDLSYRKVALPKNVDLVVINSGISHRNVGGDYNTRRAECEKACEILGISQLRDFGPNDLPKLEKLPDVNRRRAKHVITENERVLKAVQAMESENLALLGALFYESHASMKNDYEVSIPEIDEMVEIARSLPEVYGARLTGGGFGGSVVILTKKGYGFESGKKISGIYATKTGKTPTVLVPQHG